MKKILLFLMIIGLCGPSCNKELGRKGKDEDKPQVVAVVTDMANDTDDDNDDSGGSDNTGNNDNDNDDGGNSGNGDNTGGGNNDGGSDDGNNDDNNNDDSGDNDVSSLSDPEKYEHTVYTFLGVNGLYFGCSSIFKASKDQSLEITFGTSLTKNYMYTQKEFEELIHTGERKFGSLGAFTSYPERIPDRVEISYTDKHGGRWSTTKITEKQTDNGIETRARVKQRDSKFVLEDIHKIEVAAEKEGYRISGKFECVLYKMNGKAKKKIKGKFKGIVAPE